MKETEDYCYSLNEEIYYDDIDCLIDDFFKSGIHEISRAKKIEYVLSDFINVWSIFENIDEETCEAVGECAENLELTEEKHGESFKKAVDEWAEKEGVKLNFWGVHSIEKIKVKIDIDKSDYEILEDAK